MAQFMAERAARERGLAWEARSAGVAPSAPGTPTPAEVWKALGVEPGAWRPPRPAAVTEESLAWADVVLAMTAGHGDALAGRFGDRSGKVAILRPYAGLGPPSDIPDPGGGPAEVFAECARLIQEAVDRLAAEAG